MMTINWFSPLPPARSGVAEVTAIVLPLLAQRANVVLWSSQGTWDRSLEEHARVKLYDPNCPPWPEMNSADITIYHLGNHAEFHGPIWQLSRQHPGIVVLHDLKLQHFFVELIEQGKLSRDEYFAMMESHHPNISVHLTESFWRGTTGLDRLAELCPLTDAACEHALGIAVHSHESYRLLAGESKSPVAYVPLPSPTLTSGTKGDGDRDSNNSCRIIIFGSLAPNRRLNAFLTALSRLPQRRQFHVDVYGTVLKAQEFRSLITELDLNSLVTLHEYVPEAELDAALSRSDLAVNLRYPTMGEASASQLRIWQHALPSMVTETGWYATLPTDTVALVRPESELHDIQEHLTGFLADSRTYLQIGKNGQHYLREHHTVEAYVDALMNLVQAAMKFSPQWSAFYLSQRAGVAMKPWFISSAAGMLLQKSAAEIHALSGQRPDTARRTFCRFYAEQL